MRLRNLSVLGTTLVLVTVACNSSGSTPAPASHAPSAPAGGASQAPASQAGGGVAVKIGIELPMTGGEAPNGVPTANGVALALSQLQVPGFTITIEQKDDALNGKHDPQTGAAHMQALANDPPVLALAAPCHPNEP